MNEYNFNTAWLMLINNRATIKSKNSGFTYKYSSGKVKYFNPVIDGWQVCTFLEIGEILDKWIIEEE